MASFKIAKCLVSVLIPYNKNEFTIDNSYEFVDRINYFPNADNYFMASFDVENLFTNILLHETIDIFLRQLFANVTTTVLGLPEIILKF